MKKHLALAALFGVSVLSTGFAHDFPGPPPHGMHDEEPVLPGVLGHGFEPKEGPCSQLKLDATQKTKLKDAYFKFKEQKIDLESQAKKAHLKYEQVRSNPDADLKSAQDASQAIVASVTAMVQAHENYKNDVDFGILKADQRDVARACLMSMHRFHREHDEMMHKKQDDKKDASSSKKE